MRSVTVAALIICCTIPNTVAIPIPSEIRSLPAWTAATWIGMLTPFGLGKPSGDPKTDKDTAGPDTDHDADPKDADTDLKSVEYHWYQGDGTVAQHWPDQKDWPSFEALWKANKAAYIDKTTNQESETQDLHDAILSISKSSSVDPRFILATVIQESNGNVRVGTTAMANANPGLMQSYGPLCSGSCKEIPTSGRCPTEMITQMIRDGTASNSAGMGLEDLIKASGAQDVSRYYKATRMYNSGPHSIPADGDLSGESAAATRSYASDVANRLMGWTGNGTASAR